MVLTWYFESPFVLTKQFAGTSTGAFVAAGLAFGIDLGTPLTKFSQRFTEKIEKLYTIHGEEFLEKRWLGGVFDSVYKTEGGEKVLRRYLANTKLQDLKRKIIIPAL
jgi:patatin-like phospholipase/acyl hydrolase